MSPHRRPRTRRWARGALPVLAALIAACKTPDKETSTVACSADEVSDASFFLTLPGPPGLADVNLEVLLPSSGPLFEEGAPVALIFPGDFLAQATPVERTTNVIRDDRGIIQVYVDLPPSGDGFDESAYGDWRGAGSRAVMALALRYLAGEERDVDACTFAERVTVPLASVPPLLSASSNGGNLLFAMLADADETLPAFSGVTTFETPASDQFVTLEVGSARQRNPFYVPHTCTWSATDGLECPLDTSTLGWDGSATRDDGTTGAAFFDVDSDGRYTAGVDFPEWGVRPVSAGQEWLAFSVPFTEALDALGVETAPRFSREEALAFWSTRNLSRQVEAAVARFPDLKAIVIGTQIDHMLGIPDHAHVTGLASALETAGAPWVRVNPDAAYVVSVTALDEDFADNPANLGLEPGDDRAAMEPEPESAPFHNVDFCTAAATEILQRAHMGVWSDDLDEVIEAPPWSRR